MFARASITGAAVWGVAALFSPSSPPTPRDLLDTSNLALLGAISGLLLGASCVAHDRRRRSARARAHAGDRPRPADHRPARARARLPPALARRCCSSPPLLAGAGHGIAFLGGQAQLNAAAPADRRGEVNAAFYTLIYLGVASAVISTGLLTLEVSLQAAVTSFALVVGAIALLTAVWHYRGSGSDSELAAGGGDDAAGDAVPGVAGAGLATIASRVAARRSSGAASQPDSASASCTTDVGPTSKDSQSRASGGTTARSVRATSPIPEWFATTGSVPQAAASAATMPKASGNVLVIAIASAAGNRSATSSWASRPGERDASEPRRRFGADRYVRAAGSSRPSSPRIARAASRSPSASAAASCLQPFPERPEADDQQPRARLAREHERPRRQQQLDALGRDQLADVDDEPVTGLRPCPAPRPPRADRDRTRSR